MRYLFVILGCLAVISPIETKGWLLDWQCCEGYIGKEHDSVFGEKGKETLKFVEILAFK